MLAIQTIRFHHDAGVALPLRINETTPAPSPEWQAGASFSVAAYAASAVADKPITVLASFRQTPGGPSLEIRATALSNTPIPAIFSSLAPQVIAFDATGASGEVEFHTLSNGVATAGVGIHGFVWQWEARMSEAAPWSAFALTAHKIYTTLDQPTAPWTSEPLDKTLPWIEALEVACTWAAGSNTVDEAMASITKAVNALGPSLFTYDCPGGGGCHYTTPATPHFDCTAFLAKLSGGIGNGSLVNCVDCATFVSTFANILGCDLWQSRMGMIAPFFAVNPIIAIGAVAPGEPCSFPGFFFHEVAWANDCEAKDPVWDACLKVNANHGVPNAAPLPETPVKIDFGDPEEHSYRSLLVPPGALEQCVPNPNLRVRRSPASEAAVNVAPGEIAEHMRGLALKSLEGVPLATNKHVAGFAYSGDEFPGWSLVSAKSTAHVTRAAAGQTYSVAQALFAHSSSNERLLRVRTYESPSAQDARALLERLSLEFELPALQPADAHPEHVSLTTKGGGATLIEDGNLVHLVQSAGRSLVPTRDAGEHLTQRIASIGKDASPQFTSHIHQTSRDPVPVMHPAAAQVSRARWFRFHAEHGEFESRDGSVVYHPSREGPSDVSIATVDPHSGVSTHNVRVHQR